jgi:DnaJ-class molecular chaperone
VFKKISFAYKVLGDAELRDIYDRLGTKGLQRLQDGDPRVKRDWLSDDEVLRRSYKPQNSQEWNPLDDLVTGVFAWMERTMQG